MPCGDCGVRSGDVLSVAGGIPCGCRVFPCGCWGIPCEGWGWLFGRRSPYAGNPSERAGPLGRTGGAASPADGEDQPAGLATPGLLGRTLALPDPAEIRDCPSGTPPWPEVSGEP